MSFFLLLKFKFLSQIQSQPLALTIHFFTWWWSAFLLLNIPGQLCFSITIAWLIHFLKRAQQRIRLCSGGFDKVSDEGQLNVCVRLPKLSLLPQQLSHSHKFSAFFFSPSPPPPPLKFPSLVITRKLHFIWFILRFEIHADAVCFLEHGYHEAHHGRRWVWDCGGVVGG